MSVKNIMVGDELMIRRIGDKDCDMIACEIVDLADMTKIIMKGDTAIRLGMLLTMGGIPE